MHQHIPRVCHLASGDLWAGAEVQVFQLIRELARRGSFRPAAVLMNEGTLALKLRELSLEVLVLDEQRFSVFTIRKRLKEFVARQQSDILHTHRYKENIIAASIANTAPLKSLVQTVHGAPEPQSGIKRAKMSLYQHINRSATRSRFAAVVAVSHELEQSLSRQFSASQLCTIHNGIEAADPPTEAERRAARKKWSVAEEDFVFAAVGRMVPVKGFDVLLDAFAEACRHDGRLRLLIAGDGPELDVLKRRADSLRLGTHARFIGYCSEMRSLLTASNALVMSSRHEGIPLTLLEAMALQLPVVATAVGGIPEAARNGQEALLVPAADSAALARALLKLAADSALQQQLAQASHSRILECFTITKAAAAYESLYRRLLSGR